MKNNGATTILCSLILLVMFSVSVRSGCGESDPVQPVLRDMVGDPDYDYTRKMSGPYIDPDLPPPGWFEREMKASGGGDCVCPCDCGEDACPCDSTLGTKSDPPWPGKP